MTTYRPVTSPLMSPQATEQLQGLRNKLSPYSSQLIDILGNQALGKDTGSHQAYIQNAFKQMREGPVADIYQSLGTFGSGRNSGLNNALAAARANTEGSLISRTQDRQDQSLRDLLNLQTQLLGMREEEYGHMENPPEKEGFDFFGILSSLIPQLSPLFKSLFGG